MSSHRGLLSKQPRSARRVVPARITVPPSQRLGKTRRLERQRLQRFLGSTISSRKPEMRRSQAQFSWMHRLPALVLKDAYLCVQCIQVPNSRAGHWPVIGQTWRRHLGRVGSHIGPTGERGGLGGCRLPTLWQPCWLNLVVVCVNRVGEEAVHGRSHISQVDDLGGKV